LLYGILSDLYNPQIGYWILIPFYAYIVYFAASGFRIQSPKMGSLTPNT
jgi:MFS transporter, FHS family, L-fucose permease